MIKKTRRVCTSLAAECKRHDRYKAYLDTVSKSQAKLEGHSKENEDLIKGLKKDLENSKTEHRKLMSEAADVLQQFENNGAIKEQVHCMKTLIAEERAKKETAERDLAELNNDMGKLGNKLKLWTNAKRELERKVSAMNSTVQDLEASHAGPGSSSTRGGSFTSDSFSWCRPGEALHRDVQNIGMYSQMGGGLYCPASETFAQRAAVQSPVQASPEEDGNDVLHRVMSYRLDEVLFSNGADGGVHEDSIPVAVN